MQFVHVRGLKLLFYRRSYRGYKQVVHVVQCSYIDDAHVISYMRCMCIVVSLQKIFFGSR
jgi:hypothetical protein